MAQTAGWALGWEDTFTGTSVDSARWEVLTRRDSFNNEKQYYLPSQVSVGNGNLRITATNQAFDGKAYRSGLVRTWAEQSYGRWEIRGSLPSTQGMWPAIWLLPRNASWPTGGEIDIMENRGSQPTIMGSAYHYGASVAAHQYLARDFSYTVNGSPVNFQGSMHTYAVEWDPNRIRYLVDGVPHYTFYQNAAPISSTPMSLIINLAVGGDYGGDPNASTVFPQNLDIDYVRVLNRNPSTRGLANSSFEDAAGDLFVEWSEYSNATNVRFDSVAANSRSGSKAVQMYGRFDGASVNNSGLYQEMPVTPGEVWQVGAWSRNRPGDSLLQNNTAGIKIEFVDGNGTVIDAGAMSTVDVNTPRFYREAVVRRTAPPNAKFVRAVLEMIQRNNAGGAVNFDDASLRRVSGPVAGDINLDGVANSADLDALLHSLVLTNSAFDFNGDASVNQIDVDRLLADAFGTVRGDVNLDQSVNFDDLLVIAQNYSILGSGNWASGDMTGDGNVGFDDMLLVAQHYAAGNFEQDWAFAQSLAPEPTMALLSALPLGLARRSRRQL